MMTTVERKKILDAVAQALAEDRKTISKIVRRYGKSNDAKKVTRSR